MTSLNPLQEQKKPSLIEQLFPEESRRYEAQQKAAREIPQLPLYIEPHVKVASPLFPPRKKEHSKYSKAGQFEAAGSAGGPGSTVLVLRHATKNLTEEDFRRLVPQGKHIEGWTLSEGDIEKVIPARDLEDLSHNNMYFILFSSSLGAFTYQGHVTRIHRLAAQHTPKSTASTIPPPPGWMMDEIDVHSAIQAYALVPPNQNLELRQLKRPLAPLLEMIVKHGGYRHLVKRKGKLPYEARLTMEGPQLQPNTVRHIMLESGKVRGLSWSGGENYNLDITRWEPQDAPGMSNRKSSAMTWAARLESDEPPTSGLEARDPSEAPTEKPLPRRTPGVVYILGFHTESAAQSFVTHWHRRPLHKPHASANENGTEDGDTPPIANVELLW